MLGDKGAEAGRILGLCILAFQGKSVTVSVTADIGRKRPIPRGPDLAFRLRAVTRNLLSGQSIHDEGKAGIAINALKAGLR